MRGNHLPSTCLAQVLAFPSEFPGQLTMDLEAVQEVLARVRTLADESFQSSGLRRRNVTFTEPVYQLCQFGCELTHSFSRHYAANYPV